MAVSRGSSSLRLPPASTDLPKVRVPPATLKLLGKRPLRMRAMRGRPTRGAPQATMRAPSCCDATVGQKTPPESNFLPSIGLKMNLRKLNLKKKKRRRKKKMKMILDMKCLLVLYHKWSTMI